MTVEHDDRRPCDEVAPMVLAGPAPSQDEAVDLLSLPWLDGDRAAVDTNELTDGMLLAALQCPMSSSSVDTLVLCPCSVEAEWVDFKGDPSFICFLVSAFSSSSFP